MNEKEYLEEFDKILRKHFRPFLLSVIRQISEANLKNFDLVNEYCEDNKLKYEGVKPGRKDDDKAIFHGLRLKPEISRKKIEEIAKEPRPSRARSELTMTILNAMDVQAAMKLLVYRWFEDAMEQTGDKKGELSRTLDVERNEISAVKAALFVLINDRNKGIAHYSANSEMSEAEYKKKMSRVTFVYEQIGNVDQQLCEKFQQACRDNDEIIEEVNETKKIEKKWFFLIGGIVLFILISVLSIKIVDKVNTLENDTKFIQAKELKVEEDKGIQVYPGKIYCENNQLLIELWIGNGTDAPVQSANISFLLQNSAGEKIVKLDNYHCRFSEEIKRGESAIIKVHFKANQVSHKDSDLSTILWGAKGYAE